MAVRAEVVMQAVWIAGKGAGKAVVTLPVTEHPTAE